MTKYEGVYGLYRDLILSGSLRVGDRLPSVRRIAEAGGHGVNTVRTALELLERDGLIETQSRSGSRVCALPSVPTIAAPKSPYESYSTESGRRLDQIMERLALRGSSLSLAAPGDDLIPRARLQRIFSTLGPSWTHYADPSGDEGLRRAIALTYASANGPTRPEDIVVTNGATEALHLVFRRIVEPGDTVVLESPAYFDFFRQLAGARARLVEIPLTGAGSMDLDALERALGQNRAKLIVCQPNVQNPTGGIMPPEDKRRLVDLAMRHGAYVLQDDSYGDLYFSRERPPNLSAVRDWDRLILVSSFSKTLAPGLRVGWIRSPSLAAELTDDKLAVSCATNHPAQQVLARYLEGPQFSRHLRAMRFALGRRLQEYQAALRALFPENCSIPLPMGGCLLWIALPPGVSGTRVFERAAKNGVFAAPGEMFSANPFFRGYLRVNGGCALIPPRLADLETLGRIIADEASGASVS